MDKNTFLYTRKYYAPITQNKLVKFSNSSHMSQKKTNK